MRCVTCSTTIFGEPRRLARSFDASQAVDVCIRPFWASSIPRQPIVAKYCAYRYLHLGIMRPCNTGRGSAFDTVWWRRTSKGVLRGQGRVLVVQHGRKLDSLQPRSWSRRRGVNEGAPPCGVVDCPGGRIVGGFCRGCLRGAGQAGSVVNAKARCFNILAYEMSSAIIFRTWMQSLDHAT